MVSTAELVKFLRSKSVYTGVIDQLKVSFRPLICPLNDLLILVGDSKNVFDIGCGSGQFALLLAEYTAVSKIGGIEISERLIENAKLLLKPYLKKVDCQFNIYDGKEMPDSIREYNLIFLIDVLHHVPRQNQKQFLSNIFSRMEVGATLVIKDIDRGSLLVYFNKLHDIVFSKEIGNELSLSEVTKVSNEIGFKLIDSIKKRIYVYPHYTLILKK